MARVDDLLTRSLRAPRGKPADIATRDEKKNWSEILSNVIALALATELRHRGMKGVRPSGPDDLESGGRERRLVGGIGAKKVDVTWATEESGLLFAASVNERINPAS